MPTYQGNYVAENALQYIIAKNLKATRLAQSGSMGSSALTVAAEGFVNVQPMWGDLPGGFIDNTNQAIDANDAEKFTSSSIAAPIVNVRQRWVQPGVVDAVTQGDRTIITEMVSSVAGFSTREVNKIGLRVAVAGTVGANTTENPTFINNSVVGKGLTFEDIIDLIGLFQERMPEVNALFIDSYTHTHLSKLDMGANVSMYKSEYMTKSTINGIPVFVDNAMPTEIVKDADGNDVKVHTIIAGAGAFVAYGDGSVARKVAHTFYDDETDNDYLSTVQRMALACYGASFVPVAADRPATLAEIQNPANWKSGFAGLEMGTYPLRSAVLKTSLNDFELPAPFGETFAEEKTTRAKAAK